jgi:amino acid transporter
MSAHTSQVVIGYWDNTIHVGVWIAVILIVIVALNSFVVGGYGEAEFIFASESPVTVGL